jgi:hypothetical protein
LSSFFNVRNIHAENGRDFLRAIQRGILVIIILYPVLCPLGSYKKEEENTKKKKKKDENVYLLINKLEKRH